MRKAVLFFSCIFGLLFLSGVSSEEIFAPFVSGLTAEVQNHQILLSWRAAPSDIDSYVIYRSRVPID